MAYNYTVLDDCEMESLPIEYNILAEWLVNVNCQIKGSVFTIMQKHNSCKHTLGVVRR